MLHNTSVSFEISHIILLDIKETKSIRELCLSNNVNEVEIKLAFYLNQFFEHHLKIKT